MSDESCIQTVVDVARRWADEQPEDRAYVFLSDGKSVAAEISRRGLDARARAVAAALSDLGAAGKPVLILCPAGIDYVIGLFGCFYARAIAVPAYPPTGAGMARTMPRIRAICEDCRPAVILTTQSVQAALASDDELRALPGERSVITMDTLREAPRAASAMAHVDSTDSALLQYTSGSTSTPKGVLVTHGQLAANAAMIGVSSELTSADRVLSWLPPYHDMGLVGAILQPTFAGCLAILMPADAFVRRPLRWLSAATAWHASVLLAPNFALDMCVRRIEPEQRAELALSSVRVICIGAEPIRADTLERFVQAFGPHGFKESALFPCYGMAEATLMISAGAAGKAPVVQRYLAGAMELGEAQLASTDVPIESTRQLVSCGHSIGEQRLLVVDALTGNTLPHGRIGEIWVQSDAVACGYFDRPEETEQTFRAFTTDSGLGPMLRTGDLGFMDRGELFITGRLKDLIIIRGRNHFPQDIERTVQQLDDALVLDGGAAFSIEIDGSEQLAIVQEVDKRAGADPELLLARLPEAIRDAHDITPAAIVLIKRGSLGKTSSGKVQRRATRTAYLAGQLDVSASWRAPAIAQTPERKHQTADHDAKRATLTPSRRALEIESWLRERLAKKLGIDAEEIDPRDTLARYGVDSALAAEIVEDLERFLDLRLDTTISYDHPTIAGLARALAALSSRAPSTRPRVASVRPAATSRTVSDQDDPIAIVGMSCRFPGAPSLEAFWTLLAEGRDAIIEVPRERWNAEALYAKEPGTPGKMCSKWGGFIEDIDRFDASFFGVSPHEAARMDPQQRLFLEVAWEALEDAGIAPTALAGTRTGVFAGVCTSDFAMLYGGELRLIDGDYGTGSATSIVANRLSYVLDLKGPSETVDSACSSSLAALHHACQGLAAHDCDVAIVGGVNAVLAPEVNVSFSQLGALARDGRCKAFDARADGFVRSEGAGVIVLKRLSAARESGDRVYALIAGSAINHDGRSNGLSAPSGPAQRDVIERALARAAITPSDLDYVEAHGVGTQVADAVELHALCGMLDGVARQAPLVIGSAKTNVGHLEAASGMVSVIKVALALAHEQLPRQVHCEQPIAALAGGPLQLASEHAPWPRSARARYAGVSSFGFGGSNAHVVLREAPKAQRAPSAEPVAPHLVTLSARTASALSTAVRRLSEHLEQAPDARLQDVAFTLNTGRAAFSERVALVCNDADELRESLLSFALGATPRSAVRGSVKPSARPSFALVLGQTALPPGFAVELREHFPVTAPAFERAERALREVLDVPLSAALWDGTLESRAAMLTRPSIAHAALVAVQHALCTLLQELRAEPAIVLGAGSGEYAAAAYAGCITWEQALAYAARRGAVIEGFEPGAVQRLTPRDAKQALTALEPTVRTARLPLISAQLGRQVGSDEKLDAAFWSQHLLADHRASPSALEALEHAGCDMHFDLAGSAESRLCIGVLGEDAARSVLRAIGTMFARGVELDLGVLSRGGARQKLSLPTYPFERERHWLDFPERDRTGTARASSTAPPDRLTERPITHPFVGKLRSSRPAASPSGLLRKGDDDDKTGTPQ